MKHTAPAELKSLYQEGRVLPFVGAGASMALEWASGPDTKRGPSWREMVDEACRQLGYEDPELLRFRGTELQILEYFGQQLGNYAPLTNWMVRRMDAPDEAVRDSVVHSALTKLTNCALFYTTNYDDFLERSIELSGRSVQVVRTERDMGYSGKDVQVIKFHGDFNSPNNMVISEGHYYDRLRLDTPLDLKLRSDLLGRVAVFVGYSFRDLNVGYLFHVINAMFKFLPNSSTGRRAYIVVNNPSDFEFSLFRLRNMDVIPTYGDDRTAGLVEILEDIAS